MLSVSGVSEEVGFDCGSVRQKKFQATITEYCCDDCVGAGDILGGVVTEAEEE
jgi:hypothetical protein